MTITPWCKVLCRIIYQAWFHPLAKYPGPVLAKFTNLYGAYHAWRGDIHRDMHRCHQKYGDHVRYAPNRVLINTTAALRDIYGHGAHVRKYGGYQVLSSKAANTLTMSDKVQHAHRRRIISQAFSENSLRKLEPAIQARINRFCHLLRRQIPQQSQLADEWTPPFDMAHSYKLASPPVTNLAFDLMTAVSFGADYRTMEEPRFRYVVDAIEKSNVRLSVLMQASKLATGGLDRKLFPSAAQAGARFVKFLRQLLKKRFQQAPTESVIDIFSFLQQCKDPDTGEGLSSMQISTETATFIVAGSDTSSTTMAALSHYLTWSPRCYKRAVGEVRTTFSSADEIVFGAKLNSCIFLRACLDEALRITPPGGGPLWRVVEPGGTQIDGEYVPAGSEFGAGIYAMHHNPRNWPDPGNYMPERWLENRGNDTHETSEKKKKHVRQPYFPFNIGPRSCVGKHLALAQVMLTFAHLLWAFDIRRADADEGWLETEDTEPPEYMLQDHVTGQKEGPFLQFRPRV
ncbi:hypothetical protein ETB97_006441 [Aspergillus alliaceus]|uniref:Cytochrome P450 n=1 Tax=Petromyces alliaceus TaxID=209559 RepID=A0A8H5ZZ62_PETAA|nr:hypothetical protein ETB97_006441 [Aspergillus burnettii]